jgi:hypothetical protein
MCACFFVPVPFMRSVIGSFLAVDMLAISAYVRCFKHFFKKVTFAEHSPVLHF